MEEKAISKIKVLQPTDWSFQPMDDYIESGGDAFSVSRFGYEIIKEKTEHTYIYPDKTKWYYCVLERIFKLEGSNLILQIKVIRESKKVDVIYYSADRHPYLIAIAKKLKIIKKPILMLCHFSYDDTCVNNCLKKLILRIERHLVFNNIDQLLFNCETLMNLAIRHANLPEKHRKLSGWGADIDYFQRGDKFRYSKEQPFFFAAGGANRDYHTIIEAFKHVKLKLIISCPKEVIEKEKYISDNIIHFDYQKYGLAAYDMLRSYYLACQAVLIPIRVKNHVANGASVMVEAMACGKAVITTDLPTNFVNIEEEKIGYTVPLGDINSWIRLLENINYNELKVMGQRAYKLAKSKYNYKLLGQNVLNELEILR